MASRFLIPLGTLILSAALIALFWWLAPTGALYWVLLVISSIFIFLFELSVLTALFDLLSEQAILATILVLVALGILIGTGIFIRWLTGDTLLYWLTSTIFPALCGLLYVIDLLQKE
ncbi:hypothetical protein GF342_04715 [Candidatus Woesearchaeota archaeon]|nr:hypothetical protein [Candidatus Woesearchaeota archaeon]